MPQQEAGAVAIEQWAEEHKDAFKPPICNKVAGAGRLCRAGARRAFFASSSYEKKVAARLLSSLLS